MKTKIVASLLFCCILYSCRQTLYMPQSQDAAKQLELVSGRTLYIDHCSSCHNLHLPQERDAIGWKKQLDEMQVKAKITDQEKELIFRYLTAKPWKKSAFVTIQWPEMLVDRGFQTFDPKFFIWFERTDIALKSSFFHNFQKKETLFCYYSIILLL